MSARVYRKTVLLATWQPARHPESWRYTETALSHTRLKAALSAYAVLALLAGFTLTGYFRLTVWILLGAFAVKSWVAAKMQDAE